MKYFSLLKLLPLLGALVLGGGAVWLFKDYHTLKSAESGIKVKNTQAQRLTKAVEVDRNQAKQDEQRRTSAREAVKRETDTTQPGPKWLSIYLKRLHGA